MVRQQRPFVYQEVGGRRREVASAYKLAGDKRVSFEVGAYDRGLPLVIDPVLLYSTFLGGNGDESGMGVAVDASGAAYVTGETYSTNFPVTRPTPPTRPSTRTPTSSSSTRPARRLKPAPALPRVTRPPGAAADRF